MARDYIVQLRFQGRDQADAWLVAKVLTIAENARRQADFDLLDRVRFELPVDVVPPVAIDAARERLRGQGRSTLQVAAVEPGSVKVTVLVLASAWWLLNQTLGETVSEAWTETDSHKKLKQWLLRDLDQDAKAFMLQISKGTRRLAGRAVITTHLHISDGRLVVDVQVVDNLLFEPIPFVRSISDDDQDEPEPEPLAG